ncbi:PREDICTED: PRUPE_2G166200, partial [Prunus dulcis]
MEKPMIKDKAEPSDPEERVQGPRVQIQDPSLSGEWSSFIGEDESSLIVVFQCGTPIALLRVVTC